MSAIMDNEVFGWDLLYEMNKDFITSKYDIMVAVVHWALIKKGFRCVGLGDNHNITPNLELSECLPTGWTKMEFHKLRYIYNFELYILSSAKDMKAFCVNLMQPFDLSVTIINLKYDIITGVTGTLDEIMPDYINVLREINSTLINPFVKNYFTRDESTQVSATNIALDTTPRELEPIIRIFITTPMERTMSGAKLNDILNRFEEAIHYIRNPLLLLAEKRTNNERISYQEDNDNNVPGSQRGDGNFNIAGGQFVPENQVGDNGLGPHDAAGEDSQVDSRIKELLEGVKKHTNLTHEIVTKVFDEAFDDFSKSLGQFIIGKSTEPNVGQSTGEETENQTIGDLSGNIGQYLEPQPIEPENRRDDLELEGGVGGLSISESKNVDEQDKDLEEIKIDFEDKCCVKCLMK